MADNYDNDMSGCLFVNEKKTPENKQPDRRGFCEINGVKYRIAGWLKKSKAGNQFLSLSFELEDESRGQTTTASRSSGGSKKPKGDDIPF